MEVIEPEGAVIATGSHDVKNELLMFRGHEDRRALSPAKYGTEYDEVVAPFASGTRRWIQCSSP